MLRALLTCWLVDEDPNSLEAALTVGEQILRDSHSFDCALPLFPRMDDVSVSIEESADAMEALALLGLAAGGPYLGRAQHVAHILKTRQLPEGCWVERCSSATGMALDGAVCAAGPLLLFMRLNEIDGSTEYTAAIPAAREWLRQQAKRLTRTGSASRCEGG